LFRSYSNENDIKLFFTISVVAMCNCVFAELAGSALLFDGTDDYVYMPYIDAYRLSVFTYECWIKPTIEMPNGHGRVIIDQGEDKASDHCGGRFFLDESKGLTLDYENNDDNPNYFHTYFYPPVDTWTHIAVTRAADTSVNIYVNGQLLSHWDSSGPYTDYCFQAITVGAGINVSSGIEYVVRFFEGVIDDVRVWDVARSDTDIATYYNRKVDPNSAGLVGYWDFDDGFGTIASDSTGNNNAILGGDGIGSDLPVWIDSNAPIISGEGVCYVDGVNGDDLNNGLTLETAFATIQRGIDTATDNNTVLVYPAMYPEAINLLGKSITVQGVTTEIGGPLLEAPGDFAVSFYSGEDANSILSNFVIKNSEMAIFIADASPTIRHLTIVDNDYGIAAFGYSEPDISNCIFWSNANSNLSGCEALYSYIYEANEPNLLTEGLIAQGEFEGNPLFADPANDDYHLLSERGRFWPEHNVWILDNVSSPCIDSGDPAVDPSVEPMPNGGRINMGAFGETPYASMSEWPLAGDKNYDGLTDFKDLTIFCNEWLSKLEWIE